MPKKLKVKILTQLFLITATMFSLSHTAMAVDITPPSTTRVQTPATPNGDNGWYVSPITFTLNATDLESGVEYLYYKIDDNAWQSSHFEDTLNLVTNPSMEDYSEVSNIQTVGWQGVEPDAAVTYSRDISISAPGYETTSLKFVSTGNRWSAVTNKDNFAVAADLSNMNASVWVKTQTTSDPVFFKVYAVTQNGVIPVPIAESNSVTGTNDWTQLSSNFIVHNPNAIGVFLEIGTNGTGTVWVDAVSITDSITNTSLNVIVGSDNENHTLEYYSIDHAGNAESHTCTGAGLNCAKFKIDQTPPGNWNNSGAIRALSGPNYHLYVFTNVEDPTSGISTLTDSYQYYTELNSTFGRFSTITDCLSTWQPDQSVPLATPPFLPGAPSAYLITPKTSFCNNNWSICKIVRFSAEDMAGNSSIKEMCINGPWIHTEGNGIVRANAGINMLAEADGENSDGLVEVGNSTIGFFSSSRDWYLKNTTSPTDYNYDKLFDITGNDKTTISDNKLKNDAGIYVVEGDFEVNSNTLPQDFSGPNNLQIIFINGTLTISKNTSTTGEASVLFIVKNDVKVSKDVTKLNAAVLADGDFYTAYDVSEGEVTNTLTCRGIYAANKFILDRTLQGTNNSKTPSEEFIYEPKYTFTLKDFFRASEIEWITSY